MNPLHTVAVLGNLEPEITVMVLEELALTAHGEGLFHPVIVDRMEGLSYHVFEWAQDATHPFRRSIKRCVWGRIPYVPADAWTNVHRSLTGKEHAAILETTRFFVVHGESSLDEFTETLPTFLLLLRPDSGATSFLYGLMQKMGKLYGRVPSLGVLVFGTPFIESAARQFNHIKKEIAAILGSQPPLEFLGHVSPSKEKMAAVFYPSRQSMIDAFPGDSFHGQLKRAATRIKGIAESPSASPTAADSPRDR